MGSGTVYTIKGAIFGAKVGYLVAAALVKHVGTKYVDGTDSKSSWTAAGTILTVG